MRVELARPKSLFDRFHLALRGNDTMLCGRPIQPNDTIHDDTSTLWRDDPHVCANCRLRWKTGDTVYHPVPDEGNPFLPAQASRIQTHMMPNDYKKPDRFVDADTAARIRARMARDQRNVFVLSSTTVMGGQETCSTRLDAE